MFSCTFNVENTKKLIDSQIQIPKVYEDDICIFLALKIYLQSFVSVLCAKLYPLFYLGKSWCCQCWWYDVHVHVWCVCDVCDVYCVCVYVYVMCM